MSLSHILSALDEKLIVINKAKKHGQVVFLAGGGASGKGFAHTKFIDSSSFKIFDVDEFKGLIIKVAKAKDSNSELATLDLSIPDDVFKLHKYVTDKGLVDKQLNTFLNSAKESAKKGELPNIMFDVTMKDIKKFMKYSDKLQGIGYDTKDFHLVWVLADYEMAVKQNLDPDRGRVVPSDILLQTHVGAGETMSNILKGNLPKDLEGEVYVLLSDRNFTDYEENEAGEIIVGKSAISGKETSTIKDFSYVKVKDRGAKTKGGKALEKTVYAWAKTRVPKAIRHLFK